MQDVLEELSHLRQRTRRMLILQRGAVLAAWVIGAVLALILVDGALRLPSAFRLVLLAAGLAALGIGVVRYFVTALGFRPSLIQLALRAERSLPSLTGRLASSVEFAQAGLDETNPLAARSVRDAQSRLTGESVGAIVAPGRTMRDVGICVVVIAIAAGLAFASPATARTGLSRLLLPYGSTLWPARTAVASLMQEVLKYDGVHPRGQVLALRARNLTDGDADGRVDAHYRMVVDGARQAWQHAVLAHQGAGIHERLVDTNAEAIELYFATEDAQTQTERIALVAPPAITRATLTIVPPAYAEGRYAALTAELGPGLDDRAVTESASLVGSEAELVFEINKPLPVPGGAAEHVDWVRATFVWSGDGIVPDGTPVFSELPASTAGAPPRWRLGWRVDTTRTLSVALRDEHGLTSTESINYRIKAATDHPPSVTITEPQSDVAVLATAVVSLSGEAKDDVAVARLGLRAEVVKRDAEAAVSLSFSVDEPVDAANAVVHADLELSGFGLGEGDVVLVTAVADDNFELDGRRHETVNSAVRRLRIISELDFAAQLRRQLSGVRQNAIRIESLQAEIQDDVLENGAQPGLDVAQAQIGDRVAAQREAIDELIKQLEWNKLEDDQLSGLLQQSQDLVDYAGRAASRASEAIEQREATPESNRDRPPRDGEQPKTANGRNTESPGAARSESREVGTGKSREEANDEAGAEPEDAADPEEAEDAAGDPPLRMAREEDRAIAEAQQDVRDELSDLIELLDRDEDTWIVQRQLESLLESQAALQAETADLARETLGQELSELTEDQRSELDRIVQRQRELPEQARQLIEEMRRRASALEDIDPQASSGMRSAADTGEQREVDREMQAAAEKAEQNQLQGAAGKQQAAAQSLQQMLQDLEETRRARAEELLRQLASLIESIDRLIVIQENELIALAAAVERGDFSGRDRAMIRLTQNTQAVAVEARSAGQESRRIARTLDRAADAQGAAVLGLRARPVDSDATLEAEDRSLALLKEARKLADELQEQTEQDKTREQREALIAAYRELAEKQIAIRGETGALVFPEELDRRQLVESRRVGNAQQELRTGLSDIQARTSELLDSEIFSYVHRLMDQWCGEVSDALWEGRANVDTTDRQQMIADSIARQIEALEESATPPDEFADEQQQAGGAGGSPSPPQLIPPVAEIKRLHGLQEQVYDQTRGIDGREDLGPAQRRQRVRELGGMQRELMRLGERMLEKLQSGPGNLEGIDPAPETPDDGASPGEIPDEPADTDSPD